MIPMIHHKLLHCHSKNGTTICCWEPTAEKDIILYRCDAPFQEISDTHPLYPSLHYVLLFPTGQLGWYSYIPLNLVDQHAPKRKYATQADYFKYRLFPRINQSHLYGWKTFSGVCC